MVVATDLKKVAALLGSKKKRVINSILEKFESDISQLDELAQELAEDEEAGEYLTMGQAITDLINGEALNADFGSTYANAIDILCRYYGTWLSNEQWCGMPNGSWFTTVDKALKKAGVPREVFTVTDYLQYRGSPFPIPPIDGFPGVGYLRLEELDEIQIALDSADYGKISDQDVLAAIDEVRSWIRDGIKRKRDIFCLYA